MVASISNNKYNQRVRERTLQEAQTLFKIKHFYIYSFIYKTTKHHQ